MRPLTVPIFVASLGSALEVFPPLQPCVIQRSNPLATDKHRLASDWRRVGNAISASIGKAARGEKQKPTPGGQ